MPEISFDEITKLAAQITGCPFSLITFVDQDRQWFKSAYKLAAKQTPREGGFCAHAILQSEVMMVEDASMDERFKAHPFVLGAPHIKFYCAAPIVVGDDFNIGVICVIDAKPRSLDPGQVEALKSLSLVISHLLEGRKVQSAICELNRAKIEATKNRARISQMAVLSEMAGTLAHEINTPLTVIGLSANLLERALYNHGLIALAGSHLKKIENATNRIQKIIQGMRTYSRDATTDLPVLVPLVDILNDTMQFCYDRFQNNEIQFHIENFDPDLLLDCRPVEISQVLLNLLNNSIDAISELPERWVRLSVVDSATSIKIIITDSGRGISDDLKEQIFQPFFTTKKVNQGTGLGLGISRGLIEDHRGQLNINEASDHTSFIIDMPKPKKKAS